LIGVLVLAATLRGAADTAPNVITDWATIVQQSIHHATAPRSAASAQVLHAMVMLAMYDAVMGIEGGDRDADSARKRRVQQHRAVRVQRDSR
jgi:hypothetical protein